MAAPFPGGAHVMPYIGRSGWNTLRAGGAIPDDELLEAIDASYELVVSRLPRKYRPTARRPPTGDATRLPDRNRIGEYA